MKVSALFTIGLWLTFSLSVAIGSVAVAKPQVIPPLTINLGNQYEIDVKGDEGDQRRRVLVRLPESYKDGERAYPVIYVLDASSFYLRNIYQDTVATVSRLESLRDIPESIVIGIQSEHWYSEVIEHPDAFTQQLMQEVPQFVTQNFRTLPNSILVGHSYAAAFLAKEIGPRINPFDSLMVISPVFPNSGYTKDAVRNYFKYNEKSNSSHLINSLPKPKTTATHIHFIEGSNDLTDIKSLKQAIEKLSREQQTPRLTLQPAESHQSVYAPGLNVGLRHHFTDYRIPDRELLKKTQYTYSKIAEFFVKRNKRYGLTANEQAVNSAVTEIASDYLSLEKFDWAFPLWQKSQSRFKSYFLNRSAEQFLARGDGTSAEIIWKNMIEFYPDGPFAYHQLAKLYRSRNDFDQAKTQDNRISEILNSLTSNSRQGELNQFGYLLLGEKNLQQAITVFEKTTQAFPDSPNAFDSLADGYEAQGNLDSAIKARQAAVELAKKHKNDNLALLEKNLERTIKAKQLIK